MKSKDVAAKRRLRIPKTSIHMTVAVSQRVEIMGSVTLVLLPLKYEIDDSVTVTVVLLGEVGRCCTLMGWTWAYR